jgi:glycosyltransferase involved in cell wall biosynthesis
MNDPDYSIVIPVYDNEGCLTPLIDSLNKTVLQSHTGEIIFVEDGSRDGSFVELRQIQCS